MNSIRLSFRVVSRGEDGRDCAVLTEGGNRNGASAMQSLLLLESGNIKRDYKVFGA